MVGFFGGLGAAAGGTLEGQQAVMQQQQFQQQQLAAQQIALQRNLELQQQQRAISDAAGLAHLAPRQADWGFGSTPPPNPPMPGQASVPMTSTPQYDPLLQPWKSSAGAARAPVMPPTAPTLPSKPTLAQRYGPEVFENYRSGRVAQMRALNLSDEAINAQITKEQTEFNAEGDRVYKRAGEQATIDRKEAPPAPITVMHGDQAVQLQFDPRSGDWKEIGRGPRFAKQVGGVGGGGGVKVSLGNINAFLARETKELQPITDAERKTAAVVALLDSGNPVASAQVQQALSDMYSHLRATTHVYADNKNFGNIEQRLGNAVGKLFTGKYSDADTEMIKSLVRDMDAKVYAPARKRVESRYKKQAESFGIDPNVTSNEDAYAPPLESQPTPTSAATMGGKPVPKDRNQVIKDIMVASKWDTKDPKAIAAATAKAKEWGMIQ